MSKLFFAQHTEQSRKFPFVLYSLGLQHRQEYINRPSGLPLFQWIQCVKGTGSLEMKGKQFVVSEGQGMLFLPDAGHKYYSISEEWRVQFLCFSGYGVRDFFDNIGIEQSGVYSINDCQKIEKSMEQLYLLNRQGKCSVVYDFSKILYEIMLELAKFTLIHDEKHHDGQNEKVHAVMDYISEHYMDAMLLPELADHVHLSKQYLCKLFKKVNGFTIFDYITDVRIAHARTLLIESRNEKIKHISRMCGYEDISYFGMVFKKKEGVSPAKYRELYNGA